MLDPLQFANKNNRGTDDAVQTLLKTVTKHLMHPKAYAMVLFVDFSSAFDSMKIHILLKRLTDLIYDTGLVLWIRIFLSCRPQRVFFNGVRSDHFEHRLPTRLRLSKYADNMTLVGLLDKTNSSQRLWCESTYFRTCVKIHQ